MPGYRELLQQVRAEISEVDATRARELIDAAEHTPRGLAQVPDLADRVEHDLDRLGAADAVLLVEHEGGHRGDADLVGEREVGARLRLQVQVRGGCRRRTTGVDDDERAADHEQHQRDRQVVALADVLAASPARWRRRRAPRERGGGLRANCAR